MNDVVDAAPSRALTVQEQFMILPSWNNAAGFDLLQREAKALITADMLPEAYQGNFGNCMIAADIAGRLQLSPLLVMQNLFIIHGVPSWSAKFLIAQWNTCGKFTRMDWIFSKDRTECYAYAADKLTGQLLEGPRVSMAMAKAEGWIERKGSKWRTMPEMMLRNRAATFLVRFYAPELAMGLHTDDEVHDMIDLAPSDVRNVSESQGLAAVREVLQAHSLDTPPGGDAMRQACNQQQHPHDLSPATPPIDADAEGDGEIDPAQLDLPVVDPPAPRRTASPVPASPIFDVVAYVRRIQQCTDLALLQLMGEEVDSLPDTIDKEPLYAALQARDAQLVPNDGGDSLNE